MKDLLIAGMCLLAPLVATAEVVDSSSTGFTVKVTMEVHAPPAEVYRKLIRNVGDWWDANHSYSGDSHNFTIDEKAMGCFCENLANGGRVRHMEVIRYDPAKTLVMTGALGPLQAMAVTASMTIQFSPLNGGTKLEVTYAVGGYRPEGMKDLAPVVDGVVTGQFVRLKNYAEHGNPAQP